MEGVMPFVNIRLVREVIADAPVEKKTAIAEKVVAVHAAINEATGVAKKDVWVVFQEVAAEDWFVGHTSVQTLRQQS
jgi:4-oxalocrotonate tautomerase